MASYINHKALTTASFLLQYLWDVLCDRLNMAAKDI